MNKVFPHTETPKESNDLHRKKYMISDNVVAYFGNGIIKVLKYSFAEERWAYDNEGFIQEPERFPFNWMYKPIEFNG